MGNRHLILVYYKGEYRIAQYGQWDGYPSGVTILKFLSSQANIAKLIAALDAPRRLYEPTEEQGNAIFAEYAKLEEKVLMDRVLHPSPAEKSTWPGATLSRNTGAHILQLVADATEPVPIFKKINFIANTFFCEWAYVVDLDAGSLEVYEGRSGKEQHRFGEAEGVTAGLGPGLVAEFQLSALPSEEEFLKICEPPAEEESDEDGM